MKGDPLPKTAIFIKQFADWEGEARLYVLSDPIITASGQAYRKVIVAATDSHPIGTETIIYAANEDGTMASMDPFEILVGAMDHQGALLKLGYEIEGKW